MTTQTLSGQGTNKQWVAEALRSFADRLDPVTIPEPSLQEVKRQSLRAAQIALLEAEAEQERWQCTVAMFRARVERLQRGPN